MENRTITIIDYGMGNIGSVVNMLKKAGGSPVIASNAQEISIAQKLLLPGVGAFDAGMARLQEMGMDTAIRDSVINRKLPILGICLGMQLLFDFSEEGVLPGLRLIEGQVRKFKSSDFKLKVPHMGWNSVQFKKDSKFVDGINENRFYFVHSYFADCKHKEDILGETHYIHNFASMVQHGNCYGAQFHPEKSHKFGLQLLRNYLSL